jgi:hypothetical protein
MVLVAAFLSDDRFDESAEADAVAPPLRVHEVDD